MSKGFRAKKAENFGIGWRDKYKGHVGLFISEKTQALAICYISGCLAFCKRLRFGAQALVQKYGQALMFSFIFLLFEQAH